MQNIKQRKCVFGRPLPRCLITTREQEIDSVRARPGMHACNAVGHRLPPGLPSFLPPVEGGNREWPLTSGKQRTRTDTRMT